MTSNGWQKVPLGEVLTQISRDEPVHPTQEYRLLGARWYAKGLYIKEVKEGSTIRAARLYRVEEGDFVYNRLFAWKGSFALATQDDHDCYVSNEFPCFQIRESRLNARFLQYYMSNSGTWNGALELSSGGTPISRNRLKEAQFLSMPIPLPDRKEQDRIVAKLDALSARIDEARALLLESQVESLSLITGLHHSLAAGRMVKISDLLCLDEDRVPVMPVGNYPQIGIKSFGGGLFAKEPVLGLGTTYKYFNRLSSGMIVLSQVKGWEGAIAVCPDDLDGKFASPEYRTFRCFDGAALPEYLASLVRTEWFHGLLATATRGQGARRERTRPEMFLDIELPMPDINKQARAVEIFRRLWKKHPISADMATEMDALFPSILEKAFKGEL